MCNARLFDRTRPFKPIVAVRQQAAKKGLVVPTVRLAPRHQEPLFYIRRSARWPSWMTTHMRSLSVGPIPSKDTLQQHLCGWARWHTFGDSRFSLIYHPYNSPRSDPELLLKLRTQSQWPPQFEVNPSSSAPLRVLGFFVFFSKSNQAFFKTWFKKNAKLRGGGHICPSFEESELQQEPVRFGDC